MKHFIFLLMLFSSILFSKETTTHIAQLNIKSQEMQTICLKLTSDGQTLITRSDRQIHLWNSKDLKHLGSIKDVTAGYGCDLQKNDRYFLVQDMSRIYLYDLQTLKHIKNFDIPSKRHNDSIMSASFSEDGKYINSFEYTQSKPGQSKPILYRYNIDTQKREKLKSLPSFSGSYNLKGDKLYFFDSIQNKTIIYDILTNKQSEGTQKDKEIWSSIRGWWDCRENLMPTKICTVSENIKYSLASGNLQRTELNSTVSHTAKITFMHKRPLRKDYFYELGFKMPYLMTKTTQQYRGWDLSKGKQIWRIKQKMTVIAEFDSVPSKGMEFFADQDRAIVIAGFEYQIYDINTKTGLFSYVPRFKDIVAYHDLSLSRDNKMLQLTATEQKKPYPIKAHFIEVDTWKLLPSFDPKDFGYNQIENPTRYVAGYNDYFDLFRKSDSKKLASFSLFDKGEWLVMTPYGYFNASSYNVLVNILKSKHEKVTIDSMQKLAKKWYRPDIVESLLSDKNITALTKQNTAFTLPLKPVDDNQFKNSLKQMILKGHNISLLKYFKQNKNKSDIPFLHQGIESAKTSETYSAYYKTLRHYPFKYHKTFIESRIDKLNINLYEQVPLLQYLYHKKRYGKRYQKQRRAYIPQIIRETTLTDEAKMVIAKRLKKKQFETFEVLLWEVWEKQYFVSSTALPYLKKKNSKRAETASKAADFYHKEQSKNTIVTLYKELLQTKQYTNERNAIDRRLYSAYKTLNDLNVSDDLLPQKKIAMVRLDAYMNQTDLNPSTATAYLHFIMKYGSDMEKKILHTKIEIYVLQFYSNRKKLSTYALNSLLKDYFPFESDFVVQSMIKLLKSPQRRVRSDIAYHMQQIKDPKFVPVLLKKLDFKDPFISNHALDTLLRFDVPVIEQVITKLNKVDDCSKIMYLDLKNSLIAKKVSKEVFERYRCRNE